MKTIYYKCHNCNQELSSYGSAVGYTVTCPTCNEVVEVPAKSTISSPEERKYQNILNPTKKRKKLSPILLFAGGGCLAPLVLLCVIAMVATAIENPERKARQEAWQKERDTPWNEKDNSGMAIVYTKEFVKRNLKSPSTAKFPGVLLERDHWKIQRNGNNYTVRAWVDSQNGFGAMIRSHFVIKLEQVGGDSWEMKDLYFY